MSGYAAGHGAEEWNPDLFYRLKLKLWNRDQMTNVVRTPWDRLPPTGADNAHWQMGTRVVVTEDGDMHSGKTGRVVEYRGKGLYAVLMENGHKVTFSPLQWERTADQRVRAPPPPLPVDAYRSAAHHALEAVEGRHYARDGSPAHYATPGSFGRGASYGNLSARGSKGGSGDVEMTPSAASQSNPPPGTRVRIVRTYGGQLLPKDEVRTGETHQFAHGWYYITLDDSGKKESCRRNSFVVVGDEEDIELGFSEGAADAARSSRKAAYESSLFGRDAGEGGARNKDAEEDAPKEPVRTYTGKKRGRKPKERVEESESDDDDSDDEDTRKKGKKSKENKDSREEEEARIKREKEEARRRRERELEEREQEKERERERERERLREEEAKAEANMTQEERDALEAARLAAMLNRNPRRRGGGDGPAPGMQVLPRIPIKKKKEKKEDDASKS